MAGTSPPSDSGNGRVTNAVLQNELKHLRKDHDARWAEWREWCREHDVKHTRADTEIKAMNDRITRNEERLTFSNRLLGAGTVIGNILGALGIIR